MALEYINFMRIKELTDRTNLSERAGYLKEQYNTDVPSYYEFCRANGAEKPTTKEKVLRTLAFGAVGAAVGALALPFGVIAGTAAIVIGAVGLGTIAVKTNDQMRSLSNRELLNAYGAHLDNLEAKLIKENEGLVVGSAKAVGNAAGDLAKDTAKGAANLAADGIEGAGRATSAMIKRIVNGKKPNDFRDMAMISRAELEQMER